MEWNENGEGEGFFLLGEWKVGECEEKKKRKKEKQREGKGGSISTCSGCSVLSRSCMSVCLSVCLLVSLSRYHALAYAYIIGPCIQPPLSDFQTIVFLFLFSFFPALTFSIWHTPKHPHCTQQISETRLGVLFAAAHSHKYFSQISQPALAFLGQPTFFSDERHAHVSQAPSARVRSSLLCLVPLPFCLLCHFLLSLSTPSVINA